MNNNKKYILTVIGILLLAGGLILIKTKEATGDTVYVLPYLYVGLGCGLFGHGMGEIVQSRIMKSNQEAKNLMEIEKKDERNIAILNRSKAKAYDMMVFVFGALLVSLALMNTDIVVILMLVCSYLFVVFYGIYYRIKYEKEM